MVVAMRQFLTHVSEFGASRFWAWRKMDRNRRRHPWSCTSLGDTPFEFDFLETAML